MQSVTEKAKNLLETATNTVMSLAPPVQHHPRRLNRSLSPRPGSLAKYMKAEVDDVAPKYIKQLTAFQLQKLQTFFTFMLDADGDGNLTKSDMEILACKLVHVAGWSTDSEDALVVKDSLRSILEALRDGMNHSSTSNSLTRDEFVNFFGKHSRGAASVNDFPHYVQLIPRILFFAIGSGQLTLSPADLGRFYRHFLPRDAEYTDEELDAYTQRAYRAFTANGEIPLTAHVYKLVFSNFLLGRSPQTPGKYILPCFDVDGKMDAKRYQINWQTS